LSSLDELKVDVFVELWNCAFCIRGCREHAQVSRSCFAADDAADAVLDLRTEAAAAPAKAQWFGWGRPYFGYAGWPVADGYAGFPRLGYRCGCFYRPGYAYAAYFPRYRFYRPG